MVMILKYNKGLSMTFMPHFFKKTISISLLIFLSFSSYGEAIQYEYSTAYFPEFTDRLPITAEEFFSSEDIDTEKRIMMGEYVLAKSLAETSGYCQHHHINDLYFLQAAQDHFSYTDAEIKKINSASKFYGFTYLADAHLSKEEITEICQKAVDTGLHIKYDRF